jgi:putative RecB family exonuclease
MSARTNNATTPASTPEAGTRTEKDIIAELLQTVSASRLTLFLQCRLKFFYRYVLSIPKPKTPALHVGNAVHAALKARNRARWLQQPLSLKALHDTYSAAWTDESEGKVDWAGAEAEEKATGWRLFETYLREHPLPEDLKPDAIEVSIEADLRQHGLPRLVGILDLVLQRRIIDYKTSSTTPNPEKVAHTHEVQTSGYALLYRHNTGQRELGLELHHLVKLKNPKVVVTPMPPMSDEQQTRLFHLMDAYQTGLQRGDFVPSPGMQCASCEFFIECRCWK